jgi:hypothetical protein
VGGAAVHGAGGAQAIQGLEALGRFGPLRRRSGTWAAVFKGAGEVDEVRKGNGYLCGFSCNQRNKRYTRRQVDFFAAYVIPEDLWYIIPAAAVLKKKGTELMLYPVQTVLRDRYKYEVYREAWKLLRGGAMPGAVRG